MHQSLAERIALSANLGAGETVLEIGPGQGKLTETFLRFGATVMAIEKDVSLIDFLKNKFLKEIKEKRLKLLSGDAKKVLPNLKKTLVVKEYKIIANIPYNLTGWLIKEFLENLPEAKQITLLLQKEVAKRILADKQKESILSLTTHLLAETKYHFSVSRGNFFPAPKVDSAVISFFPRKAISSKDQLFIFALIKSAFKNKRKTLVGNLAESGYKKAEILKILAKLNFDPKIRAEDIPKDFWLKIFSELKDGEKKLEN